MASCRLSAVHEGPSGFNRVVPEQVQFPSRARSPAARPRGVGWTRGEKPDSTSYVWGSTAAAFYSGAFSADGEAVCSDGLRLARLRQSQRALFLLGPRSMQRAKSCRRTACASCPQTSGSETSTDRDSGHRRTSDTGRTQLCHSPPAPGAATTPLYRGARPHQADLHVFRVVDRALRQHPSASECHSQPLLSTPAIPT